MTRDIIARLPLELSQRILLHLEPHHVIRCLSVSKAWRCVANTDYVWRTVALKDPDFVESSSFPDENCEDENECNDSGGMSLCFWASQYISWLGRLCSNWANNQYTTYEYMPDSFVAANKVNGNVLVIAYVEDFVEILSYPTLQVQKSFKIPIPGHERITIQVEGDIFTVTKANISIVYRRPSKDSYQFCFCEAIAIGPSVISTRDSESLKNWCRIEHSRGVLWESRCLVSGCLWVFNDKSGLVWDTTDSSSLRLGFSCKSLTVFSKSSLFALTESGTILHLDPKGTIRKSEEVSIGNGDTEWGVDDLEDVFGAGNGRVVVVASCATGSVRARACALGWGDDPLIVTACISSSKQDLYFPAQKVDSRQTVLLLQNNPAWNLVQVRLFKFILNRFVYCQHTYSLHVYTMVHCLCTDKSWFISTPTVKAPSHIDARGILFFSDSPPAFGAAFTVHWFEGLPPRARSGDLGSRPTAPILNYD